jgi:photosystem II stability/assembly factor-like uncharacterized protein
MSIKKLFVILLFISSLSACKKDEIELLTDEVNSGTKFDLWDVQFVSDSIGYMCGGQYWDLGVCMKTTDGGHTWNDSNYIFHGGAFSMHFFNEQEGFICGINNQIAFTANGGNTFSSVYIDPVHIPAYQVVFNDRQHGVVASGGSFGQGTLSHTADGGLTWSQTEYTHNFASISYADSNTVYAGGYGVVYKSTDKGASFNPTYAKGDYFKGIHFFDPITGIAVGYEGLIIKTRDGGQTWDKSKLGNGPFSKREYLSGVDFWDNNTGYVFGEYGAMYKTTDGGDNWQKVKQFTGEHIRGIHLFNAREGIVVCSGGKVFLFKS